MSKEEIKYTIHNDWENIVVRTEDGGVASIDWNGNHYYTTYYQTRDTNEEVDWDKLAEGKTYCKDWDAIEYPSVDAEMITDALEWLCCGDYEFRRVVKPMVLAKTNLNVSGTWVKARITRTEDGNLEVYIDNAEKHFPLGTCVQGHNDEIIITKNDF